MTWFAASESVRSGHLPVLGGLAVALSLAVGTGPATGGESCLEWPKARCMTEEATGEFLAAMSEDKNVEDLIAPYLAVANYLIGNRDDAMAVMAHMSIYDIGQILYGAADPGLPYLASEAVLADFERRSPDSFAAATLAAIDAKGVEVPDRWYFEHRAHAAQLLLSGGKVDRARSVINQAARHFNDEVVGGNTEVLVAADAFLAAIIGAGDHVLAIQILDSLDTPDFAVKGGSPESPGWTNRWTFHSAAQHFRDARQPDLTVQTLRRTGQYSEAELKAIGENLQELAESSDLADNPVATPEALVSKANETWQPPENGPMEVEVFRFFLNVTRDPGPMFAFFDAYPEYAPQFADVMVSLSTDFDTKVCNTVGCPAIVARSGPGATVRAAIGEHVDARISDIVGTPFEGSEGDFGDLVELAAWAVHFTNRETTKRLTDYLVASWDDVEFSGMGEAFSSSFLAMVQYMNDDAREIRGVAEAASDEKVIAELASSWMADLVAFQGDAEKAIRLMAPAWRTIKAKEPTADPRYGGVLSDKAHAALVAATIEWIGAR